MTLMSQDLASAQVGYAKPPKAVLDVLSLPPQPSVRLNPTYDTLLIVQSSSYPSIADQSRPYLKLAGFRVDPKTSGPYRNVGRVTGLTLMPVEGGHPRPIRLPEGSIGSPEWSPDGKRLAIIVTQSDSIELWIAEVETAEIRKIPGVRLNAAFGDPVQWMPDSKTLLCELVPVSRGKIPEAPNTPEGPTVQESSGKAAPVRTYQDLLQNAHDEALFEHFGTSQLATVDATSGAIKPVGEPAIFATVSSSPSGNYLLVSKIQRPFSYLYTASSFPRSVQVWDRNGKAIRTIADLPLQDKVPIEGVPTGPRNVRWAASASETLLWTEALDGGNPNNKVPFRDQIWELDVAKDTEKRAIFKTEHRATGISFFGSGAMLISDYDRDRRWSRTQLVDKDSVRTIFDRSIQDRYNDPGMPLTRRNNNGRSVIWESGGKIFLVGAGASPKGDRPFLDRMDLKTGTKERLFQSGEQEYSTATPLDAEGSRLLIDRESPQDPGNYYLRVDGKETAITTFVDPAPQLRQIKKQLVSTKRPDGVTISFVLYLPPDYKEGERRPTIFWAYPREFNTADTAGQVVGSTNRFTRITGYSHLYFLLMGYVVMDEVSVPIVGPPDKANDTFVEQLVGSAKAAIDKAVEMGPVDRDRIGVGGHSYGAFMTANLLAHSDLFRAGIARSGAYNRSLTPFGFQNERRTFWEAPDVYSKMSPFNNANKINEPILLIHGIADANPGTFPMQSERLYQAIRGNGGTSRLVMLPHEAHGYVARESIEHVLAEQISWFEKHVRNAPARSLAPELKE